MIQPKTRLPKEIFEAQKFIQKARYCDNHKNYLQAVKYYLQATKKYTRILKTHPNIPFHRQHIQEVWLCHQRVNQLKTLVINSIEEEIGAKND